MKPTIITLALLFCSLWSIAQDKIHKKDKSVIECKIIEIGIDEIKYKLLEDEITDSPIITISVDQISKIVLSSGREITFTDKLNDPNSYADDRKHAIKFLFLSPLLEHMSFSYERNIKPGRSFESELGFIGFGFNTDDYVKSSGVFISSAFKFLKTPDFYTRQFKYAHILKGGYVSPQIILSVYQVEDRSFTFTNIDNEKSVVAGAFLINIGKQIVYDNIFLIDYSVGVGYGFSNQGKQDLFGEEFYRNNHYGFILGDNDTPLAFAARLKIGLLIK